MHFLHFPIVDGAKQVVLCLLHDILNTSWANSKPTLGQRIMFAGYLIPYMIISEWINLDTLMIIAIDLGYVSVTDIRNLIRL